MVFYRSTGLEHEEGSYNAEFQPHHYGKPFAQTVVHFGDGRVKHLKDLSVHSLKCGDLKKTKKLKLDL